MERYHTIIKIERVRKELQQGKLLQAFETASKINVKKLKSMADLSLVAEALFHGEQYEKAKEYYLVIRNKTNSRRVLSQLVHVSIKLKEIEEAERYLNEYIKLAPEDIYCYIYQYSLYKLKGNPLSECIKTLEALKEIEYIDHWAYELAKLYYKSGEDAKCIKECNDIILWFGEGEYVERARALKAYFSGEVDGTIAGQNAEQFAKDIQRILKRDEQPEIPEPEVEVQQEILESEMAVQQEITEPSDEFIHIVNDESIFDDISKNLIASVTGIKQDEISDGSYLPRESDSERLMNQQFDNVGKMTKTEKTIKVSEIENKDNSEAGVDFSLLQEEIENFSLSQEEFEKEVDENQILSFPAIYDTELNIDPESTLWGELKKNDISISETFGNFVLIDTIQKQLIKSLGIIYQASSQKANIIISCDPGLGSLQLMFAKIMAKLFFKLSIVTTNKVGLIHADRLNSLDLLEKKKQLEGTCIIVESAGRLHKARAEQLIEMCHEDEKNMAVILLDTKTNIKRLLRNTPKMNTVFRNRINFSRFSTVEWKKLAYELIKKQDYEISLAADRLLGERIDEILQTKKGDTWNEISAFMNKVIQQSEKRNGELLISLSTAGNFDSTQLMVIREIDFKF